MRKILITSIITILILTTACTGGRDTDSSSSTPAKTAPAVAEGLYLDTYCSVTVYKPNEQLAADYAMDYCKSLAEIVSMQDPESELYKLNANTSLVKTISPELKEVLEEGLKYGKLTEGKFDITIGAVSREWDFSSEAQGTDDRKPPNEWRIFTLLQGAGYEHVEIDGDKLMSLNGTNQIFDLGGIAKGWIADKMSEYLKSQGIESALIDLGGNILTIGDQPERGYWTVAIETIEGSTLHLPADTAAVTAGIYPRTFDYEGKTYFHILDPDTGFPAETDVYSATVVSKKAAEADALSTICVLYGTEKALEFIKSQGAEAVILTRDGEVKTTDGIQLY
jgi:thiamine biosynthesis lipoprotein